MNECDGKNPLLQRRMPLRVSVKTERALAESKQNVMRSNRALGSGHNSATPKSDTLG